MNIRLLLASAAFLATILAANYATGHYGLVPVGFGLVATAGTYFAGLTFVLRDLVHDLSGRWFVMLLIVVGAGLSFAISPPFIALASGVAFLLAETADLLVYTPLRRRGYVRAAVASNVAGSLVDTVVFLAIAGVPSWSSLPGQMLAKLTVTLVVVVGVVVARALLRQPVRA
jgi:uncharacterized PurR-regulated membrane protein YhhQ (DUF165 family)